MVRAVSRIIYVNINLIMGCEIFRIFRNVSQSEKKCHSVHSTAIRVSLRNSIIFFEFSKVLFNVWKLFYNKVDDKKSTLRSKVLITTVFLTNEIDIGIKLFQMKFLEWRTPIISKIVYIQYIGDKWNQDLLSINIWCCLFIC